MSWHETHLRWQALREVEAAAERDPEGPLPWREEYAALFGDRDGLTAALRYRWTLSREAQLDPHLTDVALDETRAALARRHAAVVRVVRRHEEAGLAHAS